MRLQDLFQAYFDARRHKRRSASALRFEMHYERNLFTLYEEIISGRYRISPSVCFISFRPVQREVFAADFRDRIVHHLLYNYINPVFERLFVSDCYSCRKGKGTLYGIRRADHFIRSCSENYTRDCYVLKLDIQGYFMAIDRRLLFDKVQRVVRRYCKDIPSDCELLLQLLHQVIFHDPTAHCQVRGRREDWAGLPKSKSLFFARPNSGLPIGNLTSQLFGNVYLNEFDHWMKCKLQCRSYGRYVDDIFVVHRERGFLKALIPTVGKYLRGTLALELHERKLYLQHFRKGMPFLGAVIKPYRLYIGRRTKASFFRSIQKWNAFLSECKGQPTRENMQAFLCSVNAYLGAMKHFRTYKLRRKLLTNVLTKRWMVYSRIAPAYNTITSI